MKGTDRKSTFRTLARRLSAVLVALGRRARQAARRWGASPYGGLDRLARLWPQFLQEALARRGWAPPTRVLGLDVDGDRVFAVQLRRRGGVVVVERAEHFPVPAGSSAQSPTSEAPPGDPARPRAASVVDADRAARILAELEQRGFRARELATVISREHTFQRTLHLPPATPEELEAMAALKSERELPLAAEQACTDFLFVGPETSPAPVGPSPPSGPIRRPAETSGSEGEEGHLVIVCAAAREVAHEATAPWAEVGLRPRALDVVGQSAFWALRPLWSAVRRGRSYGRGSGELVCLLLVRETVTELVIGGDLPLFTRAIFPGGAAFQGDGREATVQVAREVVRSLRAFAAEFPGERVSRVVLVCAGDTVGREGLEQEVGLPVEVLRRIDCAELGLLMGVGRENSTAGESERSGNRRGRRPAQLEAGFAAALGVAWQELTEARERVNFLAPRRERRRLAERYRQVRAAVAAAALAVVVVLVPLGVLTVRGLRLALVERQLRVLGPQVEGLKAVRSRLELVRPWTSQKHLALDVLARLTEVADADAYLRTASISEAGAVVLEGFATGPEAAYRLVAQLARGPAGGPVTDVTYTRGHTGGDAQFSHQFTITAQVRGWSSKHGSRGRR